MILMVYAIQPIMGVDIETCVSTGDAIVGIDLTFCNRGNAVSSRVELFSFNQLFVIRHLSSKYICFSCQLLCARLFIGKTRQSHRITGDAIDKMDVFGFKVLTIVIRFNRCELSLSKCDFSSFTR